MSQHCRILFTGLEVSTLYSVYNKHHCTVCLLYTLYSVYNKQDKTKVLLNKLKTAFCMIRASNERTVLYYSVAFI